MTAIIVSLALSFTPISGMTSVEVPLCGAHKPKTEDKPKQDKEEGEKDKPTEKTGKPKDETGKEKPKGDKEA